MTDDRRYRIGIFSPGDGTGGPWRYVHSILAEIDPTEFDVTVYCDLAGEYTPRPWVKVVRLRSVASFPGGATDLTHESAIVKAPRKWVRLIPSTIRTWAGFARDARELSRLLRRHPVDLFHTQNTGCEESPVAAQLARFPAILGTFHVDSSYDLHHERGGLRHRLLEIVSNRCLGAAIAVSTATAKDWIRRTHISPSRVVTIHNGIDTDMFRRRSSPSVARAQLGLPEDGRPIIGGAGRLDEAKGFSYLLDAAARLQAQHPRLMVAIAGDGPQRKDLEAQASRLGLEKVIRFLGFRRDVQTVLDALDIFVLPSLCEALPFAVLEAMATELPVVGTDVGGVAEVIVHGKTGMVVPPRDPNALAAATYSLLQSADLRRKMGAAGRDRVVQHFQERDMVQKTLTIYRNMLGRRLVRVSSKRKQESMSS